MCFVCVIGIICYVYLGGWMYKDNRRAQSEDEEKERERERERKKNKTKQKEPVREQRCDRSEDKKDFCSRLIRGSALFVFFVFNNKKKKDVLIDHILRETKKKRCLEHQMFIHIQMRMRNSLFILCCNKTMMMIERPIG